MKKIVITFVFCTLTLLTFAQDDGFRFGLHASPAFTWMSNNSDGGAVTGEGTNFAFKFGAIGESYFRENYAIAFGINMSFNQGGNLVFNSIPDTVNVALFNDSQPDLMTGGTPKVNFNYQYLEIPFSLKLRTNEMGYMRYYAEVPVVTLGINLAARGKIDESEDFRIGKDTGIMQLSWGLGGGVEYSVSESTSITGGVFFQSGIINTYYGKTGLESIDKTKSIVNAVNIRIGVMF